MARARPIKRDDQLLREVPVRALCMGDGFLEDAPGSGVVAAVEVALAVLDERGKRLGHELGLVSGRM